jgi:TolB-like protein/cytochrome c-type biogenesis protein CcmH/NrfG
MSTEEARASPTTGDSQPSTATGAVFLSYASEDAAAAQRIATALRAAGIEVWLDKSELRGGDAWDASIRRQIKECALFVPLISAHTEARAVGYFRREWYLAVDRMLDFAEDQAFLLPVVIDDTAESTARVPDRFRERQWTHLKGGETTPEWVERTRRLQTEPVAPTRRAVLPAVRRRRNWSTAVVTVSGVALVAVVATALWERRAVTVPKAVTASVPATPAPDRRTIAVLPIVNMSADKEQEYLSDGITEELIDQLAKTPGLHVIARTSSFSFKGKSDDIPTIASKLKVANILEGSMRKSGKRLRVSTQLVRAADGEHLWSETYDRSVTDVFKIEDEIATAVVQALRLKLLPGPHAPAKAADGQTPNPEAYNQYLLGRHFLRRNTVDSYRRAAAAFSKAVELDPRYARAYAGLAEAQADVADFTDSSAGFQLAREAAEKAITLGPDRADGYGARAIVRHVADLDYAGARADFERALALDPTNIDLLTWYARSLRSLGELDASIAGYRKVAELDPLNSEALGRLGALLTLRRDYAGARAYLNRALELDPDGAFVLLPLSKLELASGHPREALAAAQKIRIDDLRLSAQANAEHSLGDEAASERDLRLLETHSANVSAFQIAEVHAWHGDRDGAFAWLERARRQRDGGYEVFKSDTYLEGLYTDPRYKALLREVNLPE